MSLVVDIDENTPHNRIYVCADCGKVFTVMEGRRRKYCSEICASRGSKRINKTSVMVNKDRGTKGGKIGDGQVYVIGHSPFEGPVKIGKTANNAKKRLQDIQIGSPNKLKILAIVDSTDCDLLENQLHRQFSRNRLVGEWFDIHPNQAVVALHQIRSGDIKPSMCKLGYSSFFRS